MTILFVLLVGGPLITAIWFGLRMVDSQAREERQKQQQQIESIASAEMENTRNRINDRFANLQRELTILTETTLADESAAREIPRNHPLVRQVFILENDGRLLFPSGDPSRRTAAETEFLDRSAEIWSSQKQFYRSYDEGTRVAGNRMGWHTWYWSEGLQLLFWKLSAKNGRVIGLDIDRSALLATLLQLVPENTTIPEGAVQLINTGGTVFHQWGSNEDVTEQQLLGTVDLRPPLTSWKLMSFAPASAFGVGEDLKQTAQLGFYSTLGIGGLLTILAALWFYRESSKGMREAEKRVSFVNHVSHEFRTPLTNILLYTDLAQAEEDAGKLKDHLSVVEDEGRRLHRLVDNVLSFARSERGALIVRKHPIDIDNAISEEVDAFRQAFEEKEIEVELQLQSGGTALADAEAIREITGNLLGNVEKYGASGRWVRVSTDRDGSKVTISVEDKGPGLTKKQARRIFKPFYRAHDNVTEGAAGAGIGLSIVQRWVRLHGGTVRCRPGSEGRGIRFDVSIEAPHPSTRTRGK
ncbi:MAG: HAMP domain-containing sensor histidine kinase [Verrucomicrobiota bacterium]